MGFNKYLCTEIANVLFIYICTININSNYEYKLDESNEPGLKMKI